MSDVYLSDYFKKQKKATKRCSLNVEKLMTSYRKTGEADYKLLIVPLYVVFYLVYSAKSKAPEANNALEIVSKAINGQGIDFFLADSKGKSPMLVLLNYHMIKIFNKLCTFFALKTFKVYEIAQIAKFNGIINIILFGILLSTLGKYLFIRTVQKKIILLVQFSFLYFFKNQFIGEESNGLINEDLVFNNFALGVLLFLNVYQKNKIHDIKHLLLTSLLLGGLVSVKPVCLTSGLVYIWLILYWIWQQVSVYQFDLSISTASLFIYQIVFKVAVMCTIPLFVYYQFISIYLGKFAFDDRNIDFVQLPASNKLTFASLKQHEGVMLGVPKDVRYMDTVLIRHTDSLGGYLHSHEAKLQAGSGQQQVTVYDYDDMMNEWIILPGNKDLRTSYLNGDSDDYEAVKRSNIVLLKHRLTGKYLYVHPDTRGPVSEKEKAHEVTCKEFDDSLDDDDSNFKFRIEYSLQQENSNVQIIDNNFELVSTSVLGCKLISHSERLPYWGFFQQEVICMEMATYERSQFIIEKIISSPAEATSKNEFRYVENLKWVDLIKDYLLKSWKKEIYEDNLKLQIDTYLKKITLVSNKEAIFKFSSLYVLHFVTIAIVVVSLSYILVKTIMILPFEGNVNWFKNIESLRAKQFRYLTNLLILLLGLVIFSLSLIHLHNHCILGQTVYQFGLTLQVIIITEFISLHF